jgi:hypothetical protein
MKKVLFIMTIATVLVAANLSRGEEKNLEDYRGVVTFQLIPAKVLQVNKIIEDPKPGTSYIGEDSILVEVDENPKVMANWTVVNIKYYKYPSPKIIKYKIFSEQKELTVNYHAVSVVIDGDLSKYIQEQ